MLDIKLSLSEILSLLGVTQCIYILVYFVFRAGHIVRAGLPFLYFFVLSLAFATDLSSRFLSEISVYFELFQYGIWFLTLPFAVLLVFQIARITQLPPLKYLLLVPVPAYAFAVAYVLNGYQTGCHLEDEICSDFTNWFVLIALILGGLCLLLILVQRDTLSTLSVQKFGKERYWLILATIIMNVVFLISMFGHFVEEIGAADLLLIRTVLGLSLIYLITTSLFRIYPQSIRVLDKDSVGGETLSDTDLEIALKIERLIALEKVYHEPGYGRSDLARELRLPESVLSRIINVHFDKTLPQLFNEKRVADSKILLRDTRENIAVIAGEVGFNSLATFNRVFREVTGISPSAYRQNAKKR